MGERTRLGLGVIGAALALGGLGDLLLRATPWGLNFPLWVAALVLLAAALARLCGVRMRGEGRWLGIVAVLFAAGLAWRDSTVLAALNVLAVLVALSLCALRARSGSLRRAGVSGQLIGAAYVGVAASAGPLPAAAKDVNWSELAGGGWREPAFSALRGTLLAVPLLLVFGGLMVAADAAFEAVVRDLIFFDLERVLEHALLTGAVAWGSAGLLWAALLARNPQTFAFPRPRVLSIGSIEVGIVLGLLDALFLAFVAFQVRYLFGVPAEVAGMTYAEYARRGFFELVAVTALVLPLLLAAHWALRDDRPSDGRLFRVLAGAMIGLLAVVVASALWRMRLYFLEFGLTELRFYATAFMLWLVFVLAWLASTILRRTARRDRFAFGVLVSWFAAILLLNAANPDALIARVNLDRMRAEERFDPHYLASLSADAAPVVLEALPDMSPKDRRILENEYPTRWKGDAKHDWRTWNLSRHRAERLNL